MRRLLYYIINPFKSKSISLIGMIRFTTDLLERFKARNGEGQFDARIAATESALEVLEEAYTVDIGKLGIRKARKSAKNQFRETLSTVVETIFGKLIAVYGAKSDPLKEFFPHGRSIYHHAADDALKLHLNNLVDQVTAHQEHLGASLLEEVTLLRDEWVGIHEASEESTGQKALTEAIRRNARADLADELFENLLMVSSMNKHQPNQLGLYMQQYLLGGPASGPVSAPHNTPPASVDGSTSGSTSTATSSAGSSSVGSSISSGSTSMSSSMTSSSSATSMSGSSTGSTSSTGSSSSA